MGKEDKIEEARGTKIYLQYFTWGHFSFIKKKLEKDSQKMK